jgi:hypothetical protein
VRRSRFRNATESAVQANNVGVVSLVRLDVGNLTVEQDDYQYGGPFALDVSEADSLYLDSLLVHDNPFGAVICRYCGDVVGMRSVFTHNGQYVWTGYKGSAQVTTLAFDHPQRVLLYQDSVEGTGDIGAWFRVPDGTGGRELIVDSSAFGGQTTLIEADGPYAPGSGDSLVVARSALRGHDLGGNGVQSYGMANFTLVGSRVDSMYNGVYVSGPGTARFIGNALRAFGGAGIELDGTPFSIDSNAVTGCASGGTAVSLYRSSGAVTRNQVTGCTYAVHSSSGYTGGLRVSVLGNAIVRDTADPSTGAAIHFVDTYDSVIVARNTILGGRGPGVWLDGSYLGNINGARVDSNTVQGVLGGGVALGSYITNPVAMRYNVLADNGTGLLASVAVLGEFNTLTRNKVQGASFSSVTQSQFRFGNYVGNGSYAVVNSYGGPPPVVADSSYWGRATGPRCFAGCDTSSATVGDSVSQYVTFLPYDTALVASAPPIPSPLPAAIFRAARPVTAVRPRENTRRPSDTPAQPRRVQP